MEIWQFWITAALILVIIEIFTSGFAVICIAFGCAVAAICAALDANPTGQILCFAVATLLSIVFVRPLMNRLFVRRGNQIKTNSEALIGRKATVSQKIVGTKQPGRVAIDGDDWKAVAADEQVIEVGATVEIISMESIILTVKPH